MSSTTESTIQQLYIAYFGRPADPAGLASWSGAVNAAGGSLTHVIAGFSASAESAALYGSSSPEQLVSHIYQSLFNRAPEAAGLAYWSGLLQSGSLPPAQAAFAVLNAALSTDAAAVSNKLQAAMLFTAQLDTPAEITGYAGMAAAALARSFLAGVDASPASLAAATSPAALAAAVAAASGTSVPAAPDPTPGPTPPPPLHFTLTAGADEFTGAALDDTFTSTVAGGFSAGDILNGGAGNDTLTVTDASFAPSNNVTHIETANFTATNGSLVLNTSGWTGLNQLNATQKTQHAVTLTAGSATAITLTAENRGNADLTVDGGSAVTINALNSGAGLIKVGSTLAPSGNVTIESRATGVHSGAIQVTAGSAISVTQLTPTNNATPADFGTVTLSPGSTASVKNFKMLDITSTGLQNLTLAGVGGAININAGTAANSLAAPLNLTLSGVNAGTLRADGHSTLVITTGAAGSTLGGLSTNSAMAITIQGGHGLNLGPVIAGMGSSVNASAASGTITMELNGASTSYRGGSGIDRISLTANTISKEISGGTGGEDQLTLSALTASHLKQSNLVSGFERLVLTGAAAQTVDVAAFVGTTTVSTLGGNGLTLDGMTSGQTLELTGGGTSYTVAGDFNTGTPDTLNLHLKHSAGFAAGNIATAGIENIAIVNTDTQGTPTGNFFNSVSLSGTDIQTITVTGNAGLSLTAGSTALTTVNASGISRGGFEWTAGALTAATAAIQGSAHGSNTVNLTAATSQITYTGGSGDDSVTVTNSKDHILNLGGGTNTATLGQGNDTVTLGAINGVNAIDFGSGSDKLVLAGIASTKNAYASVSGMAVGEGDTIDFSGVMNGKTFTQNISSVPEHKNVGNDLTAALNIAAAGVIGDPNSLSPVLSWFQFRGDTYIVLDTSASTSFENGHDTVVQLAGVHDLSSSSFNFSNNLLAL